MRIVAGLAKGRRLAVPGAGTRPTSDRAREGLFNTLTAAIDLDGAQVLDLFAGTGAVGLEALSRGAAAAVFVERDRDAASVLRRNVETVGLPGARIVQRDVETTLRSLAADDPGQGPTGGPFDLVFADPPYAYDDAAWAALLLTLCVPGRLAADAVVVVERSSRDPAPAWPDCITPWREKRYGEGLLWYGRAR